MVLNKRERYIAIGVGVALALLVFDRFLFTPYVDELKRVSKDHDDAVAKLSDANDLFARERRLRKIWAQLQSEGVNVSDAQAESQTLQGVLEWARQAGVNVASFKGERATQQGAFHVLSYNFTGNGSMRSVSRLLWAVETAGIPIRLNDVQVTARKEGTDDLSVRLSLSTLCMPPDKAGKVAGATATGGRS